jgi:hypothetical protein
MDCLLRFSNVVYNFFRSDFESFLNSADGFFIQRHGEFRHNPSLETLLFHKLKTLNK